MNENQAYNPLEIKDGLIYRFANWCKRKIKSIITVGSIGLILAGIQTYKTIFAPDIASEIYEVINSTIREYDAIEPVVIPDSLIKYNHEVQLLKSYQDEFEIYKLYLQSLNTKEIQEQDDMIKLRLYKSRYEAKSAIGKESLRIMKKAQEILLYEKNTIKNKDFEKTINADLMYLILDMQKKTNNEKQTVLTNFSFYENCDWNKLTSKEKQRVFEILNQGYASESFLKTVKLQTEFHKSLYISVSIRLREIIRESTK